jgi:hypothetical protein
MNIVAFVGFYAYINEMHGSRSKIPSKNLVRQRCAEGFNSGVKGLNDEARVERRILFLMRSIRYFALDTLYSDKCSHTYRIIYLYVICEMFHVIG